MCIDINFVCVFTYRGFEDIVLATTYNDI